MKIEYQRGPEFTRVASFTMAKGDDFHLHIRDGADMRSVIGHSTRQFGRALIMPNLKPPITTVNQALDYHERIIETLLSGWEWKFKPLMTLYLTDSTTATDIREAKASGFVHAFKYYPAGATTNSDNGVTDIENVYPVLEMMEEARMVLCMHGEVTDPAVDVFDREKVFIDTVLHPLVLRYPKLKIVMEHITTAHAAMSIADGWPNVFATITAHHLLENRNALFRGGISPHNYCLPVLKRERDRQELLKVATNGNHKFFLGTDSAPHPKNLKEHACGCAGCYTAFHAMELYTEAFESVGALEKLEGFVSHNGADFYGLPRNTDTVTLVREEWRIPNSLPFGDGVVIPFRAGEMAQWKMK